MIYTYILLLQLLQLLLPQNILEWCPSGRRRKGKTQNSWMQEVTTGMREKGINSMGCFSTEEWRRKMKL